MVFLGSLLNLKQNKSHAYECSANHLSIGHIDAKMAAEYTKWKYCETIFRDSSHTVKLRDVNKWHPAPIHDQLSFMWVPTFWVFLTQEALCYQF